LAIYTTAAQVAGVTEDVMIAYLPIVLRQYALQWLRHQPRHCIDDWSDFSRCFIANFQSLSDKPAQPWDLKSIRRQNDETLRSNLKRFQTMRNCIPKVAKAAVIEDFYRGSNDSAFVRAILQKAPTTSEQLFREASPQMSGTRTSSEVRNLHHPCHDATRTSNLTSAGRRGLARRCTPPDHPSLEPVVRLAKVYRHWMKSSTPSAPTTRTCATPYGIVGTSSTSSGMTYRSSLYHLLHREEGLASLGSLNSKKGEGAEISHALTGRSMSSSKDMGHNRTGGSKNSTTGRSWWPPPVPQLLIGVRSMQ
jgi:hypothetical protein